MITFSTALLTFSDTVNIDGPILAGSDGQVETIGYGHTGHRLGVATQHCQGSQASLSQLPDNGGGVGAATDYVPPAIVHGDTGDQAGVSDTAGHLPSPGHWPQPHTAVPGTAIHQ